MASNILSLPLDQICMLVDTSQGSNSDVDLANSTIVNLCNKIAPAPIPFNLPNINDLSNMPLESLCLMVDTTGIEVNPNADLAGLTLPQICLLTKPNTESQEIPKSEE